NTCSSDTLCDTVNIIYNKPDDFYLKVYPNPTLRFINIEFGNLCMENTEIIVTDEIGKIIHSGKLIKSNENNTYSIDLYKQASGVYFLQIKNENYNSIIKIVRQD
ncbi:MAG: T9SS type A sorting domain-containing protein, partial [Bacteroidales bacterium]|nr:T9SS type A sorting domain-containing protein [Bacteroidales bacterium]